MVTRATAWWSVFAPSTSYTEVKPGNSDRIVRVTLAPSAGWRTTLGVWATAIFSVVLVRTAWVGDDAYFTLRTIDNFVNGLGLRWNAAERVQTFTHPLWLMVLTPFYWLTGEPYFTTVAVSIVLSLLTVGSIVAFAPSPWSAATGALILLLSAPFIDYSTSGLENPLTNLLLVAILRLHFTRKGSPLTWSLLACLVMLNRIDLGLVVLPLLWFRLWGGDWRASARAVALGFLPLVLWEIFSLVYYGFPFPNTAYAKLATGIESREAVQQGIIYLIDAVRRDPLTVVTITSAVLWSLVVGPRGSRPVAFGIVAYVGYVVWSGGDFMAGRMLVAPLVMAVMILVAADVTAGAAPWGLMPVVALLGSMALHSPLSRNALDRGDNMTASGVVDERGFYFGANGLLNYSREVVFPGANDQTNGHQTRERGNRLIEFGQVGMLGYFAGPTVHIIDHFALGDPLLSRLPSARPWRPGHYRRAVPPGYRETLDTGTNQLVDTSIAAYYERLSLVVRGPIWDRRRLMTILRINLGAYDHWLPKVSAPLS